MSTLDNQTLYLLKTRDPQFLAQLFTEINPSLFKILSARNIGGEQAEDLIFESWRVFFEKIDSFRGHSQIKTFIAGILINKSREFYRDQLRTDLYENADEVTNPSFTSEGWWKHDPLDPAAILSHKQSAIFINDCLEGLSGSQKEAFLMRELLQEESSEICKILSVSVTHLGVLIHRAKIQLRQCLEGKV